MKKRTLPVTNIGVSSIITIFLALFLITFAALSMLTANSDYQLSKKCAENTTSYYAADAQAKKSAAAIEEILYQLYLNSDDREIFFAGITPELFTNQLSEEISAFLLTNENTTISYETTLSDTQILSVSLTICYPELEGDTLLHISSWQVKDIVESENEYQ